MCFSEMPPPLTLNLGVADPLDVEVVIVDVATGGIMKGSFCTTTRFSILYMFIQYTLYDGAWYVVW